MYNIYIFANLYEKRILFVVCIYDHICNMRRC